MRAAGFARVPLDPRVFQGSSTGLPRVLQGSSTGLPRALRGLPRALRGSSKGFPRALREQRVEDPGKTLGSPSKNKNTLIARTDPGGEPAVRGSMRQAHFRVGALAQIS